MRSTPRPRTPARTVAALRTLAACRKGSLTVSFAFTLMAMLAMLLLAVDMSRLNQLEARLQKAIDAAALAGTRDIASASLASDVRLVFDANFEQAGLDGQLIDFAVKPIEDAHGVERLELSASARLASPLGALLDRAELDWLEVKASSRTVRMTRGMELVMVLDNTGSMRSGDKIGALRDAASALTDVLFDGEATVANLWVGIVPYSATVNVGARYTAWLADPALQPGPPPASMAAFAPTTWKGCMLARPDGGDQSDAPPSTAPFDPFYWPSMDDPAYSFSGYDAGTPLNIWPVDGAVDESNAAQNQGYGPNLGCGPAILPLTSAVAEVEAKIAEMQPWHRGGTMANMGLVWGWRVLSPRWRGLWRDAEGLIIDDLPLAHGTPYMSKVVVLMTDGDNQWYKQDYTAYRYPQDGLLGGVGVDTRMLETCELLKRDGIVLYTITFGGGVSTATEELYRQCASAPDQDVSFPGRKYFHAPGAADLRAAFGAIGGQLTELRLTQ